MNLNFSYNFFLKGTIYLLLVSHLWVSMISHCHWFLGLDSEVTEFFMGEDCEKEKEDKEKNKELKVKMGSIHDNLDALISISGHNTMNDFLSLHHAEVTTPPPESIFLPSLEVV